MPVAKTHGMLGFAGCRDLADAKFGKFSRLLREFRSQGERRTVAGRFEGRQFRADLEIRAPLTSPRGFPSLPT